MNGFRFVIDSDREAGRAYIRAYMYSATDCSCTSVSEVVQIADGRCVHLLWWSI